MISFRETTYIFLSLLIILLIISFLLLFSRNTLEEKETTGSHEFNAVIIDQLSYSYPNKKFIKEVEEILNGSGFNVYVFDGKDVNVDLYKKLPSLNYQIIIFRAHSGTGRVGDIPFQHTFIFTNENYSYLKYTKEQLRGEILPLKVDSEDNGFFGIGAKFVSNLMEGDFKSSVIIMMGCSGLLKEDLARAFIDKGASLYVGWDGPVEVEFTDDLILDFLINFVSDGKTVEESISEITERNRFDSDIKLKFYPLEAKDKKLMDLIKD